MGLSVSESKYQKTDTNHIDKKFKPTPKNALTVEIGFRNSKWGHSLTKFAIIHNTMADEVF